MHLWEVLLPLWTLPCRLVLWQLLLIIIPWVLWGCERMALWRHSGNGPVDAFCDHFFYYSSGALLCKCTIKSLTGPSPNTLTDLLFHPLEGPRPDNNKKKLSQNASTGPCPNASTDLLFHPLERPQGIIIRRSCHRMRLRTYPRMQFKVPQRCILWLFLLLFLVVPLGVKE